MRKLTVLALIATVVMLSACCARLNGIGPTPSRIIKGSGSVVTEDRPVRGFTGIALSGTGRVIIELGARESLRIEAEDNLMPYLEAEVRDGILRIGSRDNVNLRPSKPLRFTVTVRELDSVTVSGSGAVEVPDLEAHRFSSTISGSGGVRIRELTAEDVQVRLSGSGSLDIGGGQVEAQQVTVSGSGRYRASEMRSAMAKVTISGSGRATVWSTDTLEVTISGSGSVGYYGKPTIDMSGGGSGTLNSLGDR